MEFSTLAPILAHLSHVAPTRILQKHGCSVTFQSQFVVHIEWEQASNTLSFYTPLHCPTVENKAVFYTQLLQTHLFGVHTQDTFFGLHEEDDQIMLFRTVEITDLQEYTFYLLLDNFVTQAEYWHNTLPKLPLNPTHSELKYIHLV